MKDLIISLQSRDIIFELAASNASDTNNNENLLDFSYRKNKTDNIMDYKDKVFVNGKLLQINDFEKISTYHWQWVVINPNLVKLDSKTPITTNNLFKEISKL